MVIGLSGRPSIFISCRSALPMEVTRSQTLALAPSGISETLGSVVTRPSQEPSRLLRLVKEALASGGASARAAVDRQRAAVASRRRKRRGFMGSPRNGRWCRFLLRVRELLDSGGQLSRAEPCPLLI